MVVAGARAEASLPPHWWLEGLLAMASAAATTPKDLALRLYFVGPEVPSSTSSANSKGCTEQLVAHALPPPSQHGGKAPALDSGSALSVRWSRHPGSLCDFLAANGGAASKGPCLLWLSNPGLGHPHLEAAWAPSLSRALGGGDGTLLGARLLITSHSDVDQGRDVAVVTRALDARRRGGGLEVTGGAGNAPEAWPLPPVGPTPFRSLRRVGDPIEGGAVAANWGGFVVK